MVLGFLVLVFTVILAGVITMFWGESIYNVIEKIYEKFIE